MAAKKTTKKRAVPKKIAGMKIQKKSDVYGKNSKGRYVIVNGKKCYNEEEFREEIVKGTED